ncbi:MAG: hypothetical protein ACI3Z0_10180, partial [Candidatus Cryptobacteroides sp.]
RMSDSSIFQFFFGTNIQNTFGKAKSIQINTFGKAKLTYHLLNLHRGIGPAVGCAFLVLELKFPHPL